jgi:hypothetical protein
LLCTPVSGGTRMEGFIYGVIVGFGLAVYILGFLSIGKEG